MYLHPNGVQHYTPGFQVLGAMIHALHASRIRPSSQKRSSVSTYPPCSAATLCLGGLGGSDGLLGAWAAYRAFRRKLHQISTISRRMPGNDAPDRGRIASGWRAMYTRDQSIPPIHTHECRTRLGVNTLLLATRRQHHSFASRQSGRLTVFCVLGLVIPFR